ncbi:lipopolysaccharide biosynthesis protein [Maritalea sp.]|uniref:lipopolysaccharide biosynthesis protein n=1 Tax=Maritalea sp. TaxID=2003361 RepID=UPI003EFAEA2E
MGIRQQLASKSVILFAIRIAGAGTIFLVQAAIARFWGTGSLGEYLVAIATINLLAITLPLGLQTVGSYFAAEYAAKNDGASLIRFAKLAYGLTLFPGILITIIGCMLVPNLGEIGKTMSMLWVPISLMSVGAAVYYINAGILVGLKRPFAGLLVDTTFRPLIVVGALIASYFIAAPDDRVLMLLWILASFYCLVIAIQLLVTVKALLNLPQTATQTEPQFKRWFYFALPWIIITLSTDFFFDADLLMLTAFLPKDQIAVFGVCTRIFVLASFGISAVYAVTMPNIMERVSANNQDGLDKVILDSNLVATGLAIILALGVAIASPLVLMLFGKDFSGGYWPLLILCVSLVVRAVFGPGPLILSSKNRPYAVLPSVALGLGMLLIANIVLVPSLGLTGAAIGAVMSYLVGSFMVWRTTKKLTDIDVSIFPVVGRILGRSSTNT